MRRTNLHTKPTETIDALDGDPGNWKDFKSGSSVFAAGTIRRLMRCHGARKRKSENPILG